ncbi:MAG: sigma-54-dependent Fis family transcriptional regulator, partial [Myxococcales bacterium]|nr:sigma-54-dependent Fis family transcriptional regulator [Myxococcales bacterium]
LIRGESGTGKELVAKALHDCSPRAGHPFKAVNCATFTGELLASELFGHTRGAFTGAVRDKPGLLQLADKGTVFLDEVAEMALDVQARLLRVLQDQTFVPLGGTTSQKVDVRFVSATHEGLRELVEQGRFRQDLMYRIRVVLLYLPPLADRTGDVEALTWHFIAQFNHDGFRHIDAIAPDAWVALMAYRWPGNVRELRNNLEQAFALGEGPVLRLEELAPELQDGVDEGPVVDADRRSWQQIERDRIVAALEDHGGRRSEAADTLGMSRTTLWRKLKKHGLDREAGGT